MTARATTAKKTTTAAPAKAAPRKATKAAGATATAPRATAKVARTVTATLTFEKETVGGKLAYRAVDDSVLMKKVPLYFMAEAIGTNPPKTITLTFTI